MGNKSDPPKNKSDLCLLKKKKKKTRARAQEPFIILSQRDKLCSHPHIIFPSSYNAFLKAKWALCYVLLPAFLRLCDQYIVDVFFYLIKYSSEIEF